MLFCSIRTRDHKENLLRLVVGPSPIVDRAELQYTELTKPRSDPMMIRTNRDLRRNVTGLTLNPKP